MPHQEHLSPREPQKATGGAHETTPWWRAPDSLEAVEAAAASRTGRPAPLRARADELAAALRALEARRSEKVLLEQALRELDADVTPEEVVREIERRRRVEEEDARRVRVRQQQRARYARGGAVAASLIAIALAARSMGLSYNDWREDQQINAARAAEQRRIAQMPLPAPQRPVVQYGSLFRMTPTTRTLGSLPNGFSFRADMETVTSLKRLLYGDNATMLPVPAGEAASVMLETNPPLGDSRPAWEMVRLNGKLYLRAYTDKRVSDEALRVGAAAARPHLARRTGVSPGFPTSQQQREAQVVLYNTPESAATNGGPTPGSVVPVRACSI